MNHCVIDGVQCTKCCQVLRINRRMSDGLFKKWSRYLNKGNYDQEYVDESLGKGDLVYIIKNMKPVKKRIAKKINPDLFVGKLMRDWGKRTIHLVCNNLTKDGCSDYENRPVMCSGYPQYDRGLNKFANMVANGEDVPYNPQCTFFEEARNIIPVVNIFPTDKEA